MEVKDDNTALWLTVVAVCLIALAMLTGCGGATVTDTPASSGVSPETWLIQQENARERAKEYAAAVEPAKQAVANARVKAPEAVGEWTVLDDALAMLAYAAKDFDQTLDIVDAQTDAVVDREKTIAQQAEQIRQLGDENLAGSVRMLVTIGIVGLVVGAVGAGLWFVPVPDIKRWGLAVVVGGGVLSTGGFLFAGVMPGFFAAAPWVVFTVAGCVCAAMIAGVVIAIRRMISVEKCIGDEAQAKLLAKGETGGARALKYAANGGSELGKQLAKAEKALESAVPEPTVATIR